MRRAILTTLLLASLFAGCLDGPGELTAQAALPVGHSEADARLDDPIFLGMAAIEGPFDVQRAKEFIQEEMEESGESANDFLDTFDFHVPNGPLGDGMTGSWFTMHAGFDESGFDVVVTQVLQTGAPNVYHERFEFEPMYVEETSGPIVTLSLPGFDLMEKRAAAQQNQTRSDACDRPDASGMVLDSPDAARIALQQPLFAEHVRNHTMGEFVYVYLPDFEPCGDEPDGNVWIVAHGDLDVLFSEGREPEMVVVAIDAASGKVLFEDEIVPTEWLDLIDEERRVTGPLLPSFVGQEGIEETFTWQVPDDGRTLWVHADASGSGTWELVLPSGVAYESVHNLMREFDDPTAGTWTLHYREATTTVSQQVDLFVLSEGEFMLS